MSAGQLPTPEFLALQAAVVGRYVIERELGRGGMGIVFLARDVALERAVAIKLLPPHLAAEDALRERFLREARTAARLMHPNIVPIHAVEAHEGLVFFVMGYVDGESLAQRVARAGPSSAEDALRTMRDVAWALAYAHSQGVVHRDIKPDNILIERQSGRAMVADFGIARVTTHETLGEPGALVGTVQYMAPEQAAGQVADGRSDIYSLAATVYFALTGESPVQAPSLPAMLTRLLAEEGPSVALARPDLPPAFAEVVSLAMLRDRERRTASAEALAAALQRLERSAPHVRPEVRRYLRSLDLLEFLATLGVSAPFVSLVFFGDGTMPARIFSGILVVSGGTIAMYLLLAPVGMLSLRAQEVSWRELVDGLEAEGTEASRVNRLQWKRAFGETADRIRPKLRLAGTLVAGLYVGGSLLLSRMIQPEAGAVAQWLPWAVASIGLATASTLLWQGLRPREAFERWLAAAPPAPLRMRVLSWLAARPWVRRFFERGNTAAPASPRVAPTATLLLERVEDLVRDLPASVRERLGDPVAIARRLEAACSKLRARGDRIDAAIAEIPAGSPSRAEFERARGQLSERLASCTAALEQLRTDLLRLNLGFVQADSISIALEKARELSAAIDAELHGQAEVKKLLG